MVICFGVDDLSKVSLGLQSCRLDYKHKMFDVRCSQSKLPCSTPMTALLGSETRKIPAEKTGEFLCWEYVV